MTSSAMWRQISEREARTAALAPFSLPSTLSLNELIAFATRLYRMLPSSPQNLDGGQIASPEPLSQVIPLRFALKNEKATRRYPSPPASMRLLPGGRWMLGVQIIQNHYVRLMCWDVNNANRAGGLPCDPVAFIDSQHTATDFIEESNSSLCVQYDPSTESVTCLIAYAGVTTNQMEEDEDEAEEIITTHLEIISLTWLSEASPQFQFVTKCEHSSSEEDVGQVSACQLDGDLVCMMLDSESMYFWDWKRSELEPIHEVEMPVHFFALKMPFIFCGNIDEPDIHVLRLHSENVSNRDIQSVAHLPPPHYPSSHGLPSVQTLTSVDSDVWIRPDSRGHQHSNTIQLIGSFEPYDRLEERCGILEWRMGSETWKEPVLPWNVRELVLHGQAHRMRQGIFAIQESIVNPLHEPLLSFRATLYPWASSSASPSRALEPRSRIFQIHLPTPQIDSQQERQDYEQRQQDLGRFSLHSCIHSGTFLLDEFPENLNHHAFDMVPYPDPTTMWFNHYKYL
ncbi:hypothetical protein DL93DRAFT_2167217 [Clavulina sp. PMI_390]|nr:hypothetical protein DL93DRAFT_2167217 [Clavulina sp. PMI_390]